ncbi:MAG TPA: PAN domain-containing protein, partial [Candidatus Tectomicrobia bacterium]
SVMGAMRGIIVPDKPRRIAAGILGAALLGVGLGMYFLPQEQPRSPQSMPAPTMPLPPLGSVPEAQKGETSRAVAVMTDFEYGTTRSGGDYRGFMAEHPSDCRDVCSNESQCVAFTFVNAGLPGPGAICWLKQTVPAPTANDCCVSGVKQAALAKVVDRGPEAIQRTQPLPATDLPRPQPTPDTAAKVVDSGPEAIQRGQPPPWTEFPRLPPNLNTAPTMPPSPMTTASITFPRDGARVGLSVFASGQITGLTPGQSAFLCVKSQAFGKLIYPQGQLNPDATGTFTLKSIYASAGYRYETFVVSTDDADAAALLSQQRYRQYGMRTLPRNTRIISPIIVVARE